MRYKTDEQRKERVIELENKTDLSKSEKMQLKRLRFILENPVLEKEKTRKRTEAIKLMKENDVERYNLMIKKRNLAAAIWREDT